MTDFAPFTLKDPDRAKQVVALVREACSKVELYDEEICVLYELARGLHDDAEIDGYCVDLGTFRGGSAAAMALGVRDGGQTAPVQTVDPYAEPCPRKHDPQRYNYAEARETFMRLGVEDYVYQHITRSDMFFTTWRCLVRVAFIDTSHSYEDTQEEIEEACLGLEFGGWIVFHDYSETYPGVRYAVDEFVDLAAHDLYRVGDKSMVVLRV